MHKLMKNFNLFKFYTFYNLTLSINIIEKKIMKFISHRGNINGRITKKENKIDYVKKAISLGFDVEVDIFFYKKIFG